jgi:hypothetical protein
LFEIIDHPVYIPTRLTEATSLNSINPIQMAVEYASEMHLNLLQFVALCAAIGCAKTRETPKYHVA